MVGNCLAVTSIFASMFACSGDETGKIQPDAERNVDAAAAWFENYKIPPISQDKANSPSIVSAWAEPWSGGDGVDVFVYYNEGSIGGLSSCSARLHVTLADEKETLQEIDEPYIEGPDRACQFTFSQSDSEEIEGIVQAMASREEWPVKFFITNLQHGVTLEANALVEFRAD